MIIAVICVMLCAVELGLNCSDLNRAFKVSETFKEWFSQLHTLSMHFCN